MVTTMKGYTMSLLNNLKTSKTKSTSNKKPYTLQEIVGVMYLIDQLKDQKDFKNLLSEKTGRSKFSLQYKFFGKTVSITNAKTGEVNTSIRSIQQYDTIQALFDAHNVKWTQETEDSYVENYLKTLAVEEVAS